MPGLAGIAEVTAAMHEIIGAAVSGVPPDEWLVEHGFDPVQLRQMAEEVADEEFAVVPGLPFGVPSAGRLREIGAKLSASERREIAEALHDTFVLAVEIGAVVSERRLLGGEDG